MEYEMIFDPTITPILLDEFRRFLSTVTAADFVRYAYPNDNDPED